MQIALKEQIDRRLRIYDEKLERITDDIDRGFEPSASDAVFLHEDSCHNRREQIEKGN